MPRLLFEKKGNAIWISHLDFTAGRPAPDRAHEDAAGSAVDVDEAFTADGGADEGSGGALYGEIKVGGPADGEVSIDFQFVVFH